MKPVNFMVVTASLLAAFLAFAGCNKPKQDGTAPSHGSQITATQAAQSAALYGNDTEGETPGEALSKINDAKIYSLGMILYATKNKNHFPTNLDQTFPYLREANQSPSGTNQFEILYQGSLDALPNPMTNGIIVIRSDPWQTTDGKWTRVYGFADGHCEAHSEPNENFDDWERQHSAVLSGNR
jgi:hypothetical protein